MTVSRRIAVGFLAAALLAGCTGPGVPASGPTLGAPAPSTVAGTSVPSTVPPAPPAPPTTAKILRFGQTAIWETGVSVMLGVPAPFKPSEYAAGATQAQNLLIQVTLKNGTAMPFDPSLCRITISSAGVEGDSIYDSSQGIGGSPSTKILPGKSATWKEGFSVADSNDLVAEVSPDWDHKSALFTN